MRADHTATNLQGPSPRGRGNLGDDPVRRVGTGSIPAWAGKPSTYRVNGSKDTVHPRVGGETSGVIMKALFWTGPSPRGRGNLTREADVVQVERSIPAWAGKPGPQRCPAPGIIGSIPAWAGKPFAIVLTHPRVGGETTSRPTGGASVQGPSPRGRGNRGSSSFPPGESGSIPAWAGKPFTCAWTAAGVQVHPRVGGETPSGAPAVNGYQGPSPRGRGNQFSQTVESIGHRSIPAWAGKPCRRGRPAPPGRVHPRVGGETLGKLVATTDATGPSPRGRGNRGLSEADIKLLRSIPAWAGKPHRFVLPLDQPPVHPRVGGETNRQSAG